MDGPEAAIAIWNPDGSLAEMSGNGTRIAARWLADRTAVAEVTVRVGARLTRARVFGDRVEQELGRVAVGPKEVVEDIELTPVSVGNPHAVVDGDPAEIGRIGPLLERHSHFPQGTNVQVARVDAPGRVAARVWERGVGETTASGTSAVAVAVALGQEAAQVRFPGGVLEVRFDGSRALVVGPAERRE